MSEPQWETMDAEAQHAAAVAEARKKIEADVRKEIRAEEQKLARADWNRSRDRWSRFGTACITFGVLIVVGLLLWWAISAIISYTNWTGERDAWSNQCRVEGGVPASDPTLRPAPIMCIINGKVVRTHP